MPLPPVAIGSWSSGIAWPLMYLAWASAPDAWLVLIALRTEVWALLAKAGADSAATTSVKVSEAESALLVSASASWAR